MEKKTIQMSVKGFVFTLILMFFAGAAISGGLVFMVTQGNEIIKEVKVYDNDSSDDYAILEEIYDKYDEYYIEDVDKETLIDNAAKGMVYGTGDTYGAYFTEEEYQEFVAADNGEYA